MLKNYFSRLNPARASQKEKLSKVAIDLFPILSGGSNGGIKVFLLDLIPQLALSNPGVEFVLLTTHQNYDELKSLTAKNISLLNVIEKDESNVDRYTNLGINLHNKFIFFLNNFKFIKHSEAPKYFLRLNGIQAVLDPFARYQFVESNIPVLSVIVDLQHKTYPFFFSDNDLILRESLFDNTIQSCDYLIAISDYTKNKIISLFPDVKTKIETIHIQTTKHQYLECESTANCLNRYFLILKKYLIYPANFWLHKNHEMLLTAFGIAISSGLPDDVNLVLTGQLSERAEEIRDLSIRMGLSDKVTFTGFVSEADLALLLKNSLGMIFPSLYEGFGMPPIEAMSLGVPVSCSKSTSLTEICGDAALYFDPRLPQQISDCIIELSVNMRLREELIQSGYQQAISYTNIDKAAKGYMAALHKIYDKQS